MKKVTLLLALLVVSLSSFAIVDGTYPLAGAPFTATITFDNTAEEFTINITGAVTTGYVSIGFSSNDAGQMSGKHVFYITNSDDTDFTLSEQILVDYGLGTQLTAQATIASQDFAAGNISITRSYAATNGGFSFSSTDTDLYFISAIGATVGSIHNDRYKGSISIGSPTGVNSLPELVGLQLNSSIEDHSLELVFPASSEGVYDVVVYNSIGQTIVTKQINSDVSVYSFNTLSEQPAGTYFVRLKKDDKMLTLKATKN